MTYVGYKTANNVKSYLVSGISSSSTTIVVNDGNIFPSQFPFKVIVEHYDTDNNCTIREIMTATARTGDIITVTRASESCVQDDTASTKTYSAVAHSFVARDVVSLSLTAGMINEFFDELEGVTGDIQTISDQQDAIEGDIATIVDFINNL